MQQHCSASPVFFRGLAAVLGRLLSLRFPARLRRAFFAAGTGAKGHVAQTAHDAAAPRRAAAGAFSPQFLQIFLEPDKRLYLLVHSRDTRANELGDPGAVPPGFVAVIEELSDLLQGNLVLPAMADELQPLHILLAIHAIVLLRAPGGSQKPFLLVVADSGHLTSGASGQFSNLHLPPPKKRLDPQVA